MQNQNEIEAIWGKVMYDSDMEYSSMILAICKNKNYWFGVGHGYTNSF